MVTDNDDACLLCGGNTQCILHLSRAGHLCRCRHTRCIIDWCRSIAWPPAQNRLDLDVFSNSVDLYHRRCHDFAEDTCRGVLPILGLGALAITNDGAGSWDGRLDGIQKGLPAIEPSKRYRCDRLDVCGFLTTCVGHDGSLYHLGFLACSTPSRHLSGFSIPRWIQAVLRRVVCGRFSDWNVGLDSVGSKLTGLDLCASGQATSYF